MKTSKIIFVRIGIAVTIGIIATYKPPAETSEADHKQQEAKPDLDPSEEHQLAFVKWLQTKRDAQLKAKQRAC